MSRITINEYESNMLDIGGHPDGVIQTGVTLSQTSESSRGTTMRTTEVGTI